MKKLLTSLLFLFLFGTSYSQTYLVGYEYWCDTDYASRVYVSTSPQTQMILDTALGFAGVSKGLHTFNIRFQQTNYFWSQTISEYFYKTGEGPTSDGKISSYRFWVKDRDSVITVHLSTPINPIDLNINLDLTWVPRGSNFLYMQFMDEQDNWSVATVDSFYRSSLPIPAFESQDTLICGLDSVHFQNNSADADEFLWYFGDGDSSTAENPVHMYQQSGTYTVTLKARDTIAGVDSIITMTDFIHIAPEAQASFVYTMAGLNVTFINTSANAISFRWEFGDGDISYLQNTVHTYPQAGNYTAILIAYDSCGSSRDTQLVSLILKTENIFDPGDILVTQSGEMLHIHFNKYLNDCVFTLQSSTGQIVRSGQLQKTFPGFSVSILTSDFASGIYFLNITDGNGMLRRKIFIGN